MTARENDIFLIRETTEVRCTRTSVILFSQAEHGLDRADCPGLQQLAGRVLTHLFVREFGEESFQVRRVADGSAPHTDGRAS